MAAIRVVAIGIVTFFGWPTGGSVIDDTIAALRGLAGLPASRVGGIAVACRGSSEPFITGFAEAKHAITADRRSTRAACTRAVANGGRARCAIAVVNAGIGLVECSAPGSDADIACGTTSLATCDALCLNASGANACQQKHAEPNCNSLQPCAAVKPCAVAKLRTHRCVPCHGSSVSNCAIANCNRVDTKFRAKRKCTVSSKCGSVRPRAAECVDVRAEPKERAVGGGKSATAWST